jgi:DNA-binding HxlR family transcriptional regulator
VSKRAHSPASAAAGIEQAHPTVGWSLELVIVFHLFGGKTLRFSDLERAIPGISQKMLTQQLRQLKGDGIVVSRHAAAIPVSRVLVFSSADGRYCQTSLR